MYNLLITSTPDQWKKNAFEIETGRAVHEYTDDEISKKFHKFGRAAISKLMTFPCLFAYEGPKGKAQIGWLTKIKPRSRSIWVEYEIEKELPTISAARITKLMAELDIRGFEINRTHWAVKDVDLMNVLTRAKVIKERHREELGKSSRLIRLLNSKQEHKDVDSVNGPTVLVPADAWNSERLNRILRDIDDSIATEKFDRAVSLAYSGLEGYYKAFVRKRVPSEQNLTEIIELSKVVKRFLTGEHKDYPIEVLNMIGHVSHAIDRARNRFSEAHFEGEAARWLAVYARDLLNTQVRLLLHFL